MLNPAQVMYLETVLGVSAEAFAAGSGDSPVTESKAQQSSPEELEGPIRILVKTPGLKADEKNLLAKIMAAAQIQDYHHVEDLQNAAPAMHVLEFSETLPLGKSVSSAGAFHWQLPALSKMTGQGSEVTALKKIAWAWMQAVAKDVR
jgi:hypothetical protein